MSRIAKVARRRAEWFIRDRFPNRRVVRDVQGVRLVLPWSHRLPDYARHGPDYGQNLVRLASLLAEDAPLTVLDVGANVGDSTAQILHAADGRVLCVEADAFYLEYLHLNTDTDERVTVVEALLAVQGVDGAGTAVRSGGTTRFVAGSRADAMPSITPLELRRRFAAFEDLRLVKSDTDGYDVALIPAIAEAWSDSHPVLFFEYDPYLIRKAGLDTAEVWSRLAELGYDDVAVWDNGGAPVGRMSPAEVAGASAVLDVFPGGRARARTYWDVAVVHRNDDQGHSALARLVPAQPATR